MKVKLLLFFLLGTLFIKSQTKEKFDYFLKKAHFHLTEKNEDSIVYFNKKLAEFSFDEKFYKEYLNHIIKTSHYYQGIGSFEKSINILQNSLNIAENFNDSYFLSEIYIDMSATYRIFHNYKKAIEYGKKATSILNNNKNSTLKSKAGALSITAAAFNEDGQLDSAFVYQKQILSFLPKIDSTSIRNNIINIGYTYMLLGDLENAKL